MKKLAVFLGVLAIFWGAAWLQAGDTATKDEVTFVVDDAFVPQRFLSVEGFDDDA